MAPRAPTYFLPLVEPAIDKEREIQEIVNRALNLNGPAKVPIVEKRQQNGSPVTVTVTADLDGAAPTTTVANGPTTITTSPETTTITAVSDTEASSPDEASTLSGGAIAGIVIGSIVGLILLIWIFRSCSNLGAPPSDNPNDGRAWYDGVRSDYPPPGPPPPPVARSPYRERHSRSRSGHHHHAHHHHRRSGSIGVVPVTEVAEVRQAPPPVVVARSGSRRRESRSPYGRYEADEWDARRGRRRSRSRSSYDY